MVWSERLGYTKRSWTDGSSKKPRGMLGGSGVSIYKQHRLNPWHVNVYIGFAA